ncbi:Holliday junction branch migration protein RuvA [Rarobacter incanus]|uniref:Holliday junction branch migration complex subunit RuvA n=1 Tax=Rarobacter incanus TaxID=153494 RepID=A0A542SN27_9MICO|nr:Holliday junction branch migration protein RuvA [Rarobacter incanus]TQK75905.1 Holliday junction DNA helicase subunit RuvA [Rarobacter incanus]
MIASLTGTVQAARLDSAVIECNGVGYLVYATPATLSQWPVGQSVTAHTSLVVREDSMTLFGFADSDERATFERLQTVSGVGPRLALGMLAVLTPDAIRAAVDQENLTALQRVPGIGKKSAQRLVLELAGKLGPSDGAVAPVAAIAGAAHGVADAVVDALVGLGWSVKLAEDAVAAVAAENPAGSTADLLRAGLKYLGGAHD